MVSQLIFEWCHHNMTREDRKNKKRGPHMQQSTYKKLKQFSDDEEQTVEDTLDALVDNALSEDGQLVINTLRAKIDWSEY